MNLHLQWGCFGELSLSWARRIPLLTHILISPQTHGIISLATKVWPHTVASHDIDLTRQINFIFSCNLQEERERVWNSCVLLRAPAKSRRPLSSSSPSRTLHICIRVYVWVVIRLESVMTKSKREFAASHFAVIKYILIGAIAVVGLFCLWFGSSVAPGLVRSEDGDNGSDGSDPFFGRSRDIDDILQDQESNPEVLKSIPVCRLLSSTIWVVKIRFMQSAWA